VTIDYPLACLKRAAEIGYPWSISPAEAAALVAEVERLRAEADEMRRWAEEAAHAENLNAQDAQKERAAVVAWLREEAEPSPQSFTVRGKEWAKRIDDIADCIERGEHRRHEEP
jgi:hypothetical protein